MDKSTQEEHISQLIQTENTQFTVAVIFLTGYIGIFNASSGNNEFYSTISNTDKDGFK